MCHKTPKRWLKFLDEIFQGDQELIGISKSVGTVTGAIKQFILWCKGKSLLRFNRGFIRLNIGYIRQEDKANMGRLATGTYHRRTLKMGSFNVA